MIESELTENYWNITPPTKLQSSVINYAGKVYFASKVYEGDNILFSKAVLRNHLSPLKNSPKKIN